MTETYYLNKEKLPMIPAPHDCIIDNISIENQTIIFKFEKDISYHDSIKSIRPDAKSLFIRFHLVESDAFSVYKWHKPIKFVAKNGYYKLIDNSAITNLVSNGLKLEYLYHNVSYNSIIVKLFSKYSIIFDAEVDCIEFEWTE